VKFIADVLKATHVKQILDNMKKQKDRPNWDESFMSVAVDAATRSSCKYLHTGAVIVKDKRIIATGYNGAPPGIENCLNIGCRKDKENIKFNDKGKGICRGTHAEMNAMGLVERERLIGTTMYSVYFPCSACAKAIVAQGIRKVVYCFVYAEPDSLTNELFDESNTTLRKLNFDVEAQNLRRLRIFEQQNLNKSR